MIDAADAKLGELCRMAARNNHEAVNALRQFIRGAADNANVLELIEVVNVIRSERRRYNKAQDRIIRG